MPSYRIVWTSECQDDFPAPYAPVWVRDLTISVGTLIKHDTCCQLPYHKTCGRHTNSPPVAASKCVIEEFCVNELESFGTCFFKVSYVVKKAAADRVS